MTRVQVESYIRITDGVFEPVRGVKSYSGDCDYVPGAISLVVDEVVVLSVKLWDDVNWLWPFIVQALDECRRTGSGTRGFPDQPISFKAELASWPGHLLISVVGSSDDHTVVAPADEFYEAVARAGLEFFEELRRLCGRDPASEREEAILRSWLDTSAA